MEGFTELKCLMSDWLASELNVEEGIAFLPHAAHRLGALNNLFRKELRDILVTFVDLRINF